MSLKETVCKNFISQKSHSFVKQTTLNCYFTVELLSFDKSSFRFKQKSIGFFKVIEKHGTLGT